MTKPPEQEANELVEMFLTILGKVWVFRMVSMPTNHPTTLPTLVLDA